MSKPNCYVCAQSYMIRYHVETYDLENNINHYNPQVLYFVLPAFRILLVNIRDHILKLQRRWPRHVASKQDNQCTKRNLKWIFKADKKSSADDITTIQTNQVSTAQKRRNQIRFEQEYLQQHILYKRLSKYSNQRVCVSEMPALYTIFTVRNAGPLNRVISASLTHVRCSAGA